MHFKWVLNVSMHIKSMWLSARLFTFEIKQDRQLPAKEDSEVESSRLAQRAAYPVFLSLGRAKLGCSVPHGTRLHSEAQSHTNKHTETLAFYDLFPKALALVQKESVAMNQGLEPGFAQLYH